MRVYTLPVEADGSGRPSLLGARSGACGSASWPAPASGADADFCGRPGRCCCPCCCRVAEPSSAAVSGAAFSGDVCSRGGASAERLASCGARAPRLWRRASRL